MRGVRDVLVWVRVSVVVEGVGLTSGVTKKFQGRIRVEQKSRENLAVGGARVRVIAGARGFGERLCVASPDPIGQRAPRSIHTIGPEKHADCGHPRRRP